MCSFRSLNYSTGGLQCHWAVTSWPGRVWLGGTGSLITASIYNLSLFINWIFGRSSQKCADISLFSVEVSHTTLTGLQLFYLHSVCINWAHFGNWKKSLFMERWLWRISNSGLQPADNSSLEPTQIFSENHKVAQILFSKLFLTLLENPYVPPSSL